MPLNVYINSHKEDIFNLQVYVIIRIEHYTLILICRYTIFLSDDPNRLMSVLAVIAMSTILVLNDPISGR